MRGAVDACFSLCLEVYRGCDNIEPHSVHTSFTDLNEAANAGDIGLVLQALREGCDPRSVDEHGYTPLHWAAGPDEGMPGDTISRRACIAILSKLGDVNATDRSVHTFRAVQHTAVRNYVGCLKCFAHVGADLSGTVHWAANAKAHAVLRELLRLGVRHDASKFEWEGCTPLMLTAAGHDSYGMKVCRNRTRARMPCVSDTTSARQAHVRLR